MKNRLSSNLSIAIIFGLIAALLAIFITFYEIPSVLELKVYDELFRIRGNKTASDKIVIVAIDNESLSWLDSWPWPRTYHAKLVKVLKKAGAAVIGFDVLFDSNSALNPEHDQEFAKACQTAGNVVFAGNFFEKVDPKVGYIKGYNEPLYIIDEASAGSGFANPITDIDGFIRRSWLFSIDEDIFYPSFGLKILSVYKNKKVAIGDIKSSFKQLLGYRIPFDEEGALLLNYVGPQGTYKTVSYDQVLDEVIFRKDPNIFKDKIVLIGATTADLHDVFPTPFSLALPGVELHATFLNMALANNFLLPSSIWLDIFTILFVGLLTGLLLQRCKALLGLLITLLEVGIYFGIVVATFLYLHIWLLTVAPIITIVLTYIGITLFRFIKEEKEKRRIKGIFSRYVNSQIVDGILKSKKELELGGKKSEVTILFSDIRNFTTISEGLEPEELVRLLNEYFTVMVDVLFKHEGMLDKYIGDAMMAIFGEPVAHDNDPERACRAALEMQAELKKLQDKWSKEGSRPFSIGIGINTGEVVVGNIGSIKRMEYTVIGDSVNLASRLEGLNKEYSTDIIISEFVYEKIKNIAEVKPLGEVTVKGKSQAVQIYELKGMRSPNVAK